MKSIFKYQLEVTGWQEVEIREGSKILCVQVQHGILCLWAMVDPHKSEMETVAIEIFGTGSTIPDGRRDYIGTAQMADGKLVWHVFKRHP